MIRTQEITNFSAHVGELRADIEEVKHRLAWLEDAPLPVADAKRNVTEAVAALKASFDDMRIPAAFLSPDRKTNAAALERVAQHFYNDPARGILALLATVPDLLTMALHQGIDDYATKVKLGPPKADRNKQKEVLERQLFGLEQEEEATICAAEAHGIEIWRRPDVDPVAVLGIFDDKPTSEAA